MTCNHSWGSELKTGFLNGSPRHRRKPAVKYHSTNNDILNFVPIVDHFSSVLILISSSSLLPTDRPYCCLNSEPLEPACCWFAMCHLCFYSENPDTAAFVLLFSHLWPFIFQFVVISVVVFPADPLPQFCFLLVFFFSDQLLFSFFLFSLSSTIEWVYTHLQFVPLTVSFTVSPLTVCLSLVFIFHVFLTVVWCGNNLV